MPTILSIETSVPNASMALQKSCGGIVTEEFESHRQQNKLLFPALEKLLKAEGSDSIDLIIVGTGPGSYSGSRIAIAAAQGLAVAKQCPVVGTCSFLGTKVAAENELSYAIGDARRGSFFIAEIRQGISKVEPQLHNEDIFLEKLATLNAPQFSFESFLSNQEIEYSIETPTARGLALAWNKLSEKNQQSLLNTPPQPAYLRAPFITKAKPGHPLLRKKS